MRRFPFSISILVLLCIWGYGCSFPPQYDARPRIVIKFAEGTDIRLEDQRFTQRPRPATGGGKPPGSAAPGARVVARQLDQLNRLLQSTPGAFVAPLFSDAGARRGAPETGHAETGGQEDVSFELYFSVILTAGSSARELDRLIDQISRLSIVQTVYEAPLGEDPKPR